MKARAAQRIYTFGERGLEAKWIHYRRDHCIRHQLSRWISCQLYVYLALLCHWNSYGGKASEVEEDMSETRNTGTPAAHTHDTQYN
jgi:hypothetical protein